jgi:type VI secretion system protein ImpK
MVRHPDPTVIRDYLVGQVQVFERRARDLGVRPETIIGARYCLCTALDETAGQTPWGGSGVWSRHSLLVTFHNETWGGEKFFQLLSKLAQSPQEHLDLLELQNVCLALGFEGRYRVIDNGRTQLETLRQRLAQILRTARGELARPLSPHWRGEKDTGRRGGAWLPVWVVAIIGALLAAGLYWWFARGLGIASDTLYSTLSGIRLPRITVAAPPKPAPPRLAKFLEPEVRDGLVLVEDLPDRSVVVIRGDGLFDPGSTSVKQPYLPVIQRIADALNAVTGEVLVLGYTDNVPIRTVRFPSNWQLSRDRAEEVGKLLDQRLATRGRIRTEGRADADPRAPNDTPENRARNRRVEIVLLLPPSEQSRQINAPAPGAPAATR